MIISQLTDICVDFMDLNICFNPLGSIPMLPVIILCLAFWETVSSVAATTKQHRRVPFSPRLWIALTTLHFLASYDFDVISRNSLPYKMYISPSLEVV